MSATLWGALATAVVLGATHAVEPDHVAGVSAVTSQYSDSWLSALVGACFGLGHVTLVVVWLAVGSLLLGRTEFPAAFDRVGTLGVAVLLGALGAAMAINGLRSIRHTHTHEHDDEVHAHSHLHLPLVGGDHDGSEGPERDNGAHSHDDAESYEFVHGVDDTGATGGRASVVTHDHGHGVGAYLKTGVVGALFTLSPPVSMIVFASTLFGEYGTGAVALAVVAYAVSITATMSAIGAGVGTLLDTTTVGPRVYAGARVLGGALVAGFAVLLSVDAVPALG